MIVTSSTRRSSELSASELSRLSDEQRGRLADVLDQYLRGLECGVPLTHDELLRAHPDLAESLRTYFHSLAELHDLAAGFTCGTRPIETRLALGEEARRLGDFKLLREIGRGGMGVVFEARQLSLDRHVAVKLLPLAAVLDARQIARFKHEAQAAAQLHHPHIVPVFAIGVERGVHYYAMQYINGQPLDAAIAELRAVVTTHGTPAPASCLSAVAKNRKEYSRAVCRLGIQAAEALHAAHDYGVVHRDIKPSNLLLEAGGKLWVTDFGLARFRRDAGLTRSGDLVGTLRYMSPEQAAGQAAHIDHRTDIYSLGATLYELLCLRPAFPDAAGPQLLKQIERGDPLPPSQVRPGISTDLDIVILKAMAKEPQDRYSTAQDFADDLARVLAGEPTVAKPLTRYERFAKWGWRHRKLCSAGLAALVLAAIGLATSTLLITAEKQHAEVSAARAAQHFREAREVLDRFGLQLSEELATVPGAEHLRQSLLAETRSYYESFVIAAKNEPALAADIALTYGKIATLLDDDSPIEALATHERAVALFADLALAEPGNLVHQQRLAVSQNNLALAELRAGRLDEAEQNLEVAVRRLRQLAARSPNNSQLAGDLALSWSNLGQVQIEREQTAAAEKSLQSAIGLLRTILDGQPNNPAVQQKLAASYNNLAGLYSREQPRRAIELHQQALRLQTAAASSAFATAAVRREQALTHSNLASAHVRVQQMAEALAFHKQALALQEELARESPANALYQRDLVVSRNNLGLLLSRLGRLDDAEAMFQQACETATVVLRLQPDDPLLHSSLASSCHNLAVVLEKGGRLAAASELLDKAIEHQRRATHRAPAVARYSTLLSAHVNHHTRLLDKLGQVGQAVATVPQAN